MNYCSPTPPSRSFWATFTRASWALVWFMFSFSVFILLFVLLKIPHSLDSVKKVMYDKYVKPLTHIKSLCTAIVREDWNASKQTKPSLFSVVDADLCLCHGFKAVCVVAPFDSPTTHTDTTLALISLKMKSVIVVALNRFTLNVIFVPKQTGIPLRMTYFTIISFNYLFIKALVWHTGLWTPNEDQLNLIGLCPPYQTPKVWHSVSTLGSPASSILSASR